MKREIEIHRTADKLPDSSRTVIHITSYSAQSVSYSSVHKLFNANDSDSEEEAKKYHIKTEYWADLIELSEDRFMQREKNQGAIDFLNKCKERDAKQQERREFVLRFLIENPTGMESTTTFEDTYERVRHALKVFVQVDKQLTELEQKESNEQG
jgi:hypothetical protein